MLAQVATKQVRLHRLAFGEHFANFREEIISKIITENSACYAVWSKVFMKYAG
jgi:hypothetical protein